ncbi:carbonic anhydrase [Romboutsia sedimentorum]|jgi:carbonic anhydrase|uniref:carbonic anhydrase n=1 Tax=Romboutsia sedimentorum TaxID=1368474 RepID=A0ABT7EB45_9FIRM|nr:carbonic anhydrase [Romboutsia sedimentorum]MDK2564140.1 carbonic anhydrase [Romboutsia sedimentorum]MDK2586694.1 carbonic anhydrase [Romboutsia sedimentorum]
MKNKIRKLDKLLKYNKSFVEGKKYEKYETSKDPDKKIVILSCMDTRLTDLLPKSMNLKNGDAKIIKNAGATIMHPFGSIMRSIIVAIYEFEVDEVLIVGHYGCGMCNLNTEDLLNKILQRGIPAETVTTLSNAGINILKFLHGFESVEESIQDSVSLVKNHPLVPKEIIVHGLVMCPETGKIDVVVDGYK